MIWPRSLAGIFISNRFVWGLGFWHRLCWRFKYFWLLRHINWYRYWQLIGVRKVRSAFTFSICQFTVLGLRDHKDGCSMICDHKDGCSMICDHKDGCSMICDLKDGCSMICDPKNECSLICDPKNECSMICDPKDGCSMICDPENWCGMICGNFFKNLSADTVWYPRTFEFIVCDFCLSIYVCSPVVQ